MCCTTAASESANPVDLLREQIADASPALLQAMTEFEVERLYGTQP